MKQLLKKIRQLPSKGHILCQVGERVRFDTVVGRLDYVPGPLTRVEAAKALSIAPKLLPQKMTLDIGAQVDVGAKLAENSEFYWSSRVISPVAGYLALCSATLGNIYVREPIATGPSEPVTIRCEELGLNKVQFAENLLVAAGHIVNRGQVILSGSKISASVLSRVESVSLKEGTVTLVPLFQPTEITALLDGVIAEVSDQEACVVASVGYRFTGEVGYGGAGVGTLRPLMAGTRDLRTHEIPEDINDCIVVVRAGIEEKALEKLAEHRIAGLVLGCIDPLILSRFSQSEPLKNLGALMNLPFPLLLMQGFSLPMPERVYREIASFEGRRALVDAVTQLRAGVIRPELLIALPEEEINGIVNEQKKEASTLQVGMKVVIKREPYLGSEALVLAVYAEREVTDAGTWAAMVMVRFDDGKECKVPLANCQPL